LQSAPLVAIQDQLDSPQRDRAIRRKTRPAAEQRLASGAFLSFFVVQFGVAAAELRRRRGRTSDEDREPPATTGERLVPGA
jgi:hypothetical protein